MPDGLVLRRRKEISFKYKFDTDIPVDYGDPWYDPWYGDYVMIVVNEYNLDIADYYGVYDGITNFQFSRYPAVYYSSAPGSSDNPELYDGYGQWATFTVNADWFDADLGASDNARFNVGDGYTPDLDALKDETEFWLGVGIATNGWYYMDDITLIFKNDDATLSNLTVSAGTLSPAFSSSTYSYNVAVANSVSSITLTATPADPNANVIGDGVKALSVGSNPFSILVTAEDILQIESGELQINKVEILDLSGKTIYKFNYPINQINVSALLQGVYFVKIETNNGIVTREFVKK